MLGEKIENRLPPAHGADFPAVVQWGWWYRKYAPLDTELEQLRRQHGRPSKVSGLIPRLPPVSLSQEHRQYGLLNRRNRLNQQRMLLIIHLRHNAIS